MDTQSTSGGTSGAPAALQTDTSGATGDGTVTAAADSGGWVRVADLASRLRRSPRRLREMVLATIPDHQQQRRNRPSGGSPELWISAAAVSTIMTASTSGVPAAAEAQLAAAGTVTPAAGAAGASSVLLSEAQDRIASLTGRAEAAEELSVERGREIERLREELARPVDTDGWRAAVQEAQARATAAEEQVEHLRAQVAGERQLLDQERESRRQADVLAKRARDEADRWRAKAEGLRVAWHDWRRALDGVGRWRLVRRKFPAEPVEFTSGPAIAAPVE